MHEPNGTKSQNSIAKMRDIKNDVTKLKLIFTVSAAFLILSVVAGTSPVSDSGGDSASSSHAVLSTVCSSTLYPDLCVSTVSAATTGREIITSQKDVIAAVLNVTIATAKHNLISTKSLVRSGRGFTARAKIAVDICFRTFGSSLEDLDAAVEGLRSYPKSSKNLRTQADDLNMLISSAMTFQQTCLDEFSHDSADMMVRSAFSDRVMHVKRLCSIALAIITDMTDTDIANSEVKLGTSTTPKLIKEVVETAAGDVWPWWLSEEDRVFLTSDTVTPNTVVAADGSGNYKKVGDAVAAAPSNSKTRYVIQIKAGAYRENVEIPSNKKNLMFVGDGRLNTIITASRSVKGGWGTYDTGTVAVNADGFLARGITFENTAGPANEQAVAIRVSSNQSAFYQCGFSAYQDTLYVHSKRQFFVNCYIAGSVDFIFGNSAVVIQDSDIQPRKPGPKQKNMITAQGRDDKNQKTGIVIQNCRINPTDDLKPVMNEYPSYLGRPWKNFSRTIVMQSDISNVIEPEGWYPWEGEDYSATLLYREYENRGEGADTSKRVKWKGFKVITDPKEARSYTAERFIDGAEWLKDTGFPYQPGL